MTFKPLPHFPKDHPIWEKARSFEDSVRAIRRAQGKKSLADCEPGTQEFAQIEEEVLLDMLSFLPPSPDEATSG